VAVEILSSKLSPYGQQLVFKKWYGYQIQKGTLGCPGLSPELISKYEKDIGLNFLRTFACSSYSMDSTRPGVDFEVFWGAFQWGWSFTVIRWPVIGSVANWLIKTRLSEINWEPPPFHFKNLQTVYPWFNHRYLLCSRYDPVSMFNSTRIDSVESIEVEDRNMRKSEGNSNPISFSYLEINSDSTQGANESLLIWYPYPFLKLAVAHKTQFEL